MNANKASSPAPAPAARPAHKPADINSARDRWAMALLCGWVAVTRLSVVRAAPGEPDSALFPVGLWRWITAGPLASRVYDRDFSPGYYWLAARLAHWGHVGFSRYVLLLNAISVLAALAAAPLAYALARVYLPRIAAFWATLLWLLAPAVWWLGIEPHPQSLAIALTLGALCLHRRALHRGGWLAWICATSCLSAALLARSDAFFVFAAFLLPVFGDGASPLRQWVRQWRRALSTIEMLACASAAFLLLRILILGTVSGTAEGNRSVLLQILGYWGNLSLSHQLLPFLTAGGVVATLAALAGLTSLPPRERAPWSRVLACWSLPSALFWLLVRGNNVRHVAFCILPLLWAGAAGWQHWQARTGDVRQNIVPSPSCFRRAHPVALVAALALAFDCLVPVSANTTLYPSGNVPGGALVLYRKEAGILSLARKLALAPAGRCYLGSYTSAYVLYGVVMGLDPEKNRLRFTGRIPVTELRRQQALSPLILHDVYSTSEFLHAAASCPNPVSLEYTAAGKLLHPLALPWLR